jgi:hypothetical protein
MPPKKPQMPAKRWSHEVPVEFVSTPDKSWRKSDFHLILGDGECYIDFTKQESSWTVTCCSFDGAGAMSTHLGPVPQELIDRMIAVGQQGEENSKAWAEIQPLAQAFFRSQAGKFKSIWTSDFANFGLI